MARLVFIDENFSDQAYSLVLETTTVGRGDQNTLVIHDDSVSSKHCEILVNGPEVIVRDLDSRNGTFVEGIKLNKQSQVKSGQIVRFGSVAARLELGPEDSESDGTEITAVHELKHIMRDQRREQKHPKPPARKKLEPLFPSPAAEKTIIMPKSARLREMAPAPAKTPEPPPARSRLLLWVIVAVGVVGLVILAWLVWGRK